MLHCLSGAGGPARAIAVELALAGAGRITVVNCSEARGAELATLPLSKLNIDVSLVLWNEDYGVTADTNILIHGTSIGLYAPEARLPLNLDSLRPGMVVADVVFKPVRTRLLADAGPWTDSACW